MEFTYFEDLWPAFDSAFNPTSQATSRGQYHFVEGEGDEPLVLYVSAPGYKSEDIAIEMHEGRLNITGTPSTKNSVGVLVPSRIKLSFAVHTSYLVDGAELNNGLLSVKLIRQRQTEALKIPIKTG